MQKEYIAHLTDVTKRYGSGPAQVTAVDSINLSLSKGDAVVLAGPSGSGKSTLLHIIGCIEKPDRGQVIIDSIDTTNRKLDELTALRLNKIGFVFQSFNLIPVLTAYENIELPLLFKQNEKRSINNRVNEVLDKVGLLNRKKHYPNQLSGGQQQRVAIARALVGNPAIILADEPTANLDSKTGAEILNLLLKLNKKENITILISSHDSVVLERITNIIHIIDGKISVDQ